MGGETLEEVGASLLICLGHVQKIWNSRDLDTKTKIQTFITSGRSVRRPPGDELQTACPSTPVTMATS